ncbi:MCP four helix bundle domain-containing protein, partial [Thermodesulfovibrio sp.]|uniref:MCP four helix bundle domain-containing protein n=1 Tax=Thermodesulfovibrio sp. TaxID=2067987 RepID=UPI003D0C9CB7
MFKNLTIGKKLTVGFGVLILLLALSSAITLIQLQFIKSDVSDIDERIKKLNYAVGIRRIFAEIINNVKNMILTEDLKKKQELKKAIDENRTKYREKLEAIKKITHTKEGEQLIKNLEEAISDAAQANNKIIELSMAGKNKEAIEIFNREVSPKLDRLFKALDDQVAFHNKTLNARLEEINSIIMREILVIVIFTAASILIGIGFAIFISRSVKNPVTELKEVLEKVAKGDLSVNVKMESKDELGVISQSLNEAIASIKKLIAESKTISTSLASSSEELSATTEEISRN